MFHVEHDGHSVGDDGIFTAFIVNNLEHLVRLRLVGVCEAAVLANRYIVIVTERICNRFKGQFACSGGNSSADVPFDWLSVRLLGTSVSLADELHLKLVFHERVVVGGPHQLAW